MLKRILKGVSANLFSQIVVLIVQLSMVPVMASTWGLEKYGVWLLLFTIPSYLALSDFGFATAAGIEMTMRVSDGKQSEALALFQSAWLAIIGFSIPVLLLVGSVFLALPDMWIPSLSGIQDWEIKATLCILALFATVCLQGGIVQAGFRCSGNFATGVSLQAVTMLCEGIVAVFLVISGASFVTVALGYLGCRIIALAVQAHVMMRVAPWLSFGFRYATTEIIKQLSRPALAVMALPAAQSVFLQGTALMVGLGASAAAVPVFTSVRTLIRTGVQMTTILNHALMPELSSAVARNDHLAKSRIIKTTLVGSLVVVVPSSIVLLLWGQKIVEVWSKGAISPDWGFIALMTAVMMINGIWHPLSNLLLAASRQSSYSYVFLFASIASVVIAYPLSVLFGASGGASAMLVLDIFMIQHVIRMTRLHIVPHQAG